MDTKLCNVCLIEKSLDSFYIRLDNRDGLRRDCKSCSKKKYSYYVSKTDGYHTKRYAKELLFPWKTLMFQAKTRAKRKGLDFDLDSHKDEFAYRVGRMICEISGVSLRFRQSLNSGRANWNAVSIDRIDSALGYTIDNIRIVCWALNAAFSTWGEKQFRVVVDGWLKHDTIKKEKNRKADSARYCRAGTFQVLNTEREHEDEHV